MDGDTDCKATGFSVGHLPESTATTPGKKDTYEEGSRIRVTFRDPPARQQDSASGFCQSHPWLRQTGKDTDKDGTTTVAKSHHSNRKDTLRLPQRYPKDTRRTPEEYPNNTPSIPEGYPKDTTTIPQGYPKDTRRKPSGYPNNTPRVPEGHPKDTAQERSHAAAPEFGARSDAPAPAVRAASIGPGGRQLASDSSERVIGGDRGGTRGRDGAAEELQAVRPGHRRRPEVPGEA